VSEPVEVAVVGVGYLGTLHAEKYAAHPRARLRALVDPDPRARVVADRLHVPLYADLAELPAEVRAVSVAVPTPLHHLVGSRLMRSGRDVLIEKPIASSPAEADELIALAEAGGRVLQVGHLERFNPAIRSLAGLLREPRFIESHRLAPFNPRGSDVDVVLDLMIHDIDIILNIVRADPASIHAAGVPVITDTVDIANARIEFEDGCVANITASRVSAQKLRKIRVFQPDAYVSIDYLRHSATIVRRVGAGAGAMGGAVAGGPVGAIVREEVAFADEETDALTLEIDAFLRAVAERSVPPVSGRDGRRALAVAEKIVEQIGARGT
jgi:predicted dehydrogenase